MAGFGPSRGRAHQGPRARRRAWCESSWAALAGEAGQVGQLQRIRPPRQGRGQHRRHGGRPVPPRIPHPIGDEQNHVPRPRASPRPTRVPPLGWVRRSRGGHGIVVRRREHLPPGPALCRRPRTRCCRPPGAGAPRRPRSHDTQHERGRPTLRRGRIGGGQPRGQPRRRWHPVSGHDRLRPQPPPPAPGGPVRSRYLPEPVGDGDHQALGETGPGEAVLTGWPDRRWRTPATEATRNAHQSQSPPSARTARPHPAAVAQARPPRAAVEAAREPARCRPRRQSSRINRDGSHARHLGGRPAGLLRCTRSQMS